MRADVVVLGAGIIGVATAVHLQKRGVRTVLVDRGQAGQGTSFGNAGLIQREGAYPYAFPRDLRTLLQAATKRSVAVNYHVRALPRLLPFLLRYWQHSAPARHAQVAKSYAALIEHSVAETRALTTDAGLGALLRPSGWIKVFRTAYGQDAGLADAEEWRREFGVVSRPLDLAGLREMEPHLSPAFVGGLHYTQPDAVSDPGGFVTGLRRHLEGLGGQFIAGDAATLVPNGSGWRVATAQGPLDAARAVLALGPWSDLVTAKLGYRFLLAVKRGYHMHYRSGGNAVLHRPVLDTERGYILAPMNRGIRLCTGAEFADRDAPGTPVQLERAERVARAAFPLADRVDDEPWMGCRPCTADMMPIIGPAPRHENLWFAFGHAHHGLTLGALTGRLVSEMATGVEPLVDTSPFRADRGAVLH